ncbi:CheR family methyltransferase [Paractinoplanes atraurantiacus]|uniref:Chemotaxis protein methyltransferase CheR n=1 Tax=Paractinoplanes atraurantiacus TaxID=1036182 RepID=A0A285HY65_9ACTN|nr:protein-glutamate O-methyltransferase CheR [Actinoplanes atraurantiacus]SNY40660.1 chemotaxis protein methyltransferase CheR [Actinoplanes atraurantiacus]
MIGAAELIRFREVLARRFGWTFADNDAGHLTGTLRERAGAAGMSATAYLDRLAARPWPEELTVLVERLSITETYFFRHGEQFRALREEALPERVAARQGQRVLRMLSVACSSGEEAYSLAITGLMVIPGSDWIVEVTGVDANPGVLSRAETALYSSWSLRETPDDVRQKWFRPEDGGYRVADEARRLVRFKRHNVAEPDPQLWAPGRYDVIFCRNLLMYLTADVVSSLIERMTTALAPGGFLFLGHTDSLGSRADGLDLRQSHQAFYYCKADRKAPEPAAPPAVDKPRPLEDTETDTSYNQALALLREERFAEALEMIDGQRGTLLHGILLAQTGRLGEAIILARRLIEENGLDPDAHQLLGLCLEGGSAVAEAIGQYRLAAYLDPGFALPRMRLGQLARRHGDERTAAGELERALDLLTHEKEERITLFGGGFGRIALTVQCRSELDACGVRR